MKIPSMSDANEISFIYGVLSAQMKICLTIFNKFYHKWKRDQFFPKKIQLFI